MTDAAVFDLLYKDSRDSLLLEAFALTGDLQVSRTAVRDAFAVAWHHWDKVRRLEDPAAWIRPHVWRRARHRHQARPWHKEKGLDEGAAATLAALADLPRVRREALVLAHLTPLGATDAARELGRPPTEAADQLQLATADFADALGIGPDEVPGRLAGLRALTTAGRWPRGSIVRRTGAARRRTHTLVGVAATLAAVVGSGMAVAQGDNPDAALSDQGFERTVSPEDQEPPVPELGPEMLLPAKAMKRRVGPDLDWAAPDTHDNTRGEGLVLPCQQARYADEDVRAALVRTFEGTRTTRERVQRPNGKQRVRRRTSTVAAAVQSVELSASPEEASAGFGTLESWLAGCTSPRTQLMAVHDLPMVGDEARLFTFRDWQGRPGTVQVGVARTGQMVTAVARQVPGQDFRPRKGSVLLTRAVNDLCRSPGSGKCAWELRPRTVTPPPAGVVPGMLSEFDLPPVTNAVGPWVGTKPARVPPRNPAATRCDSTSFRGTQIRNNLSRTFLFLEVQGNDEFGLAQSVGRMRNPRQARGFVEQVRRKIAACSEEGFGTDVTRLADQSGGKSELTAWEVEAELPSGTLRYLMAIMRHGPYVSQVGLVPTAQLGMSREDFNWLGRRALERLPRLRLEAPED